MKKLIEFKSGLRLIVCENNSVRSLAIGVYVGAGVITERENEAGISHFIEHMSFKGTKKRTAFDIVDEMDSIGANINAATAKSYTMYYTESLDEHAEKCIDVLSDMYFNPTFDSEDLKKERTVIYEEIHESEDDPFDVLLVAANKLSLEGSQFENEILGTKKSLSKIKSENLKEYHDRWYIAQNTVICLAGNITIEEATKLVDKYFETKFEDRVLENKEIKVAQIKSGSITTKRDIAQSHLMFVFPDLISNTNEFEKETMNVLTLILDGGMSSRLFQNIREKLGVCYSIGCMRSSYKDNGRLNIYTSTSPNKVEATVKAIRHEIDKLIKDGVTDTELTKAKEQAKTTFVFAEERTKTVMNSYAIKAIVDGTLYDPEERLKLIDSVTKEDVNKLVKKVFNYENLCTSLVAKDINVDVLKMFKE